MTEEKKNNGPQTDVGQAERRPYAKPSITWEESVEEEARLMSACGKLLGDPGCSGAEQSS